MYINKLTTANKTFCIISLTGKAALYASALDPRHKRMCFIVQTLHFETKDNLAEMCKTLQLPHRGTSTDDDDPQPQVSTSPATGSQNQPAATTGTKAWSFKTQFGNDYFTEDADYSQVELCFSEPCIPPQDNPLQWWKNNEG